MCGSQQQLAGGEQAENETVRRHNPQQDRQRERKRAGVDKEKVREREERPRDTVLTEGDKVTQSCHGADEGGEKNKRQERTEDRKHQRQ